MRWRSRTSGPRLLGATARNGRPDARRSSLEPDELDRHQVTSLRPFLLVPVLEGVASASQFDFTVRSRVDAFADRFHRVDLDHCELAVLPIRYDLALHDPAGQLIANVGHHVPIRIADRFPLGGQRFKSGRVLGYSGH
jgi:hypothetical protein